jgi:serine phosphatase RsbU (regulator of sigma subunit)
MKKYFPLLLFQLLIVIQVSAKKIRTDTISIQNFKSGISLEHFWKYKIGDSKKWVDPELDDSDWRLLAADSTDKDTLLKTLKGIAWFRASFYIDSTISGLPLALQMRTNGACDIFIDGKLIRSMGIVGATEKQQVSGFSIRTKIVPIPVSITGRHVLAIRASNYTTSTRVGVLNVKPGLSIYNFNAEIGSMQKALEDEQDISYVTVSVFFCGVFIVLSIFHLVLFLYYRKNRSNLYYSLFTFFIFIIFFSVYRTIEGTDLETTKLIFTIGFWSLMIVPLFFIGILYEVFYKKLFGFFWVLAGLLVSAFVVAFEFDLADLSGGLIFIFLAGGLMETVRVFIRSWIKKRDGSRIFLFGLFFPVFGVLAISFVSSILRKSGFHDAADFLSDHKGEFFLYAMLMSVSISMTIYLARDFANMNKKLYDQIKEIKHLFNITIEQENERKRILENQKDDLEKMVVIRTEEVVQQKAEIELKNRDILDNLLYARRIQDAILPEIGLIYETLRESFIIYMPKDIVSGDFYSFSQRDGKVILAAADCTGHGVTGAFMSMIGSSVLNQIINEKGITQPAEILNNLNSGITEALKQKDNDVTDGMDIALCTFDLKTMHLQFAGANRPLWIFRQGQLVEIKPDKIAIGGFRIRSEETFTNHELKLQSGDTIYLFTDGFADQFGGPAGKKLLSKRLREILSSMQDLNMREQEKRLTDIFNEWKGNVTQVDDVLVVGVRI